MLNVTRRSPFAPGMALCSYFLAAMVNPERPDLPFRISLQPGLKLETLQLIDIDASSAGGPALMARLNHPLSSLYRYGEPWPHHRKSIQPLRKP